MEDNEILTLIRYRNENKDISKSVYGLYAVKINVNQCLHFQFCNLNNCVDFVHRIIYSMDSKIFILFHTMKV